MDVEGVCDVCDVVVEPVISEFVVLEGELELVKEVVLTRGEVGTRVEVVRVERLVA